VSSVGYQVYQVFPVCQVYQVYQVWLVYQVYGYHNCLISQVCLLCQVYQVCTAIMIARWISSRASRRCSPTDTTYPETTPPNIHSSMTAAIDHYLHLAWTEWTEWRKTPPGHGGRTHRL